MTSEVGSGAVAIFPVFKGFRKAVTAEVDSTSKSASSRFSSGFKSAGSTAGQGFSAGFKSATAGVSGDAIKRASAEIAAASRAVAVARLKEQDAAGKVRIAETGLADARSRFTAGSLQVVRAEERLAAQERAVAAAEGNTAAASDRLASAKRSLASATDSATSAGSRFQSRFAQLPSILGDSGARSARRFGSVFLDVLGGALGANILTGVGFTIGRSINAGVEAGFSAAFTGVQLASDLTETTSAVRQVFGAAADDILSFSKTANTALGQTQQAALGGAQTFGIFGQAAGLTGKPLANFTTDLVTLAGDLASFKNTSPEDAIEALGAGLRGESEPLRRYGVLLDDATLRQKALELGIYDGSGALTQQQRVLAAQAEIMDQTGLAQGDFARTSEGLANQQRILQASLQDTQTKFGQYLLPAFTSAATFANDTLLPRLGEVIDRVGPKFAAALEKAAPKVAVLLDKVEPLAESFLTMSAEDGIPAVIDLLGQMADAAPAWVDAWSFLNDPNAQPAKFFNELAGLKSPFGDGGLVGLIGDWIGDVAGNTKTDFNDFGHDVGTTVGAGTKAGLGEAGPFDFDSFGTNGVPSQDFYSFGTAAGTDVGVGAGSAVGDAGAFDFDSFGAPKPVEFKQMGENYGDALAAGIKSKQLKVGLAGFQVAQEAVAQTKRGFGIHSPSKYGLGFGENFTEAVASGMSNPLAKVASSADQIVAAASLAMAATGSASSSSTSPASPGEADRPIVAETGELIGWVRHLANGEARIVFDTGMAAIKTEVLAGGAV